MESVVRFDEGYVITSVDFHSGSKSPGRVVRGPLICTLNTCKTFGVFRFQPTNFHHIHFYHAY